MDNCIFCKIAKHDIPGKIQYEDDDIIAFDDIEPKAKVHILIVPKKHIDSVINIEESDIELLGRLIFTAKKIAKVKHLTGYKLIFNVGKDGGQIIEHIHLHLVAGQNLKSIV